MEALRAYSSREYQDPLSEPPPEILAEITAGLDTLYPDQETELGKEVRLTAEQNVLAVLYYLTHAVPEGGSYRGVNTPSDKKFGIVTPISMEIGVGATRVQSSLESFEANNIVALERTQTEKKTESIIDVWITPETTRAMEAARTERSDDVAAVENHLMRYKRQTILMVRKEINHEEKQLGLRQSSFEDLSAFQTLSALDKYLAQLFSVQSRHLSRLEYSA